MSFEQDLMVIKFASNGHFMSHQTIILRTMYQWLLVQNKLPYLRRVVHVENNVNYFYSFFIFLSV